MIYKEVLFLDVTEDGKKVDIPEPIEVNVYGKVINTVIGSSGTPEGKYGVNYHMAYIDKSCNIASLVFEGKQDDFFYHFSISNITEEFKFDKEYIKKLFSENTCSFQLKWWFTNAPWTDDPGIKNENGVLVYNIYITDSITLRVTAEAYDGYHDVIHDMYDLCERISNKEYELEII